MSDYTSINEVKTYLQISGSGDDTLIGDLVTRASRIIDDQCGRFFYTESATRYYDAIGDHISGRILLLDTDLVTLTSITNGDGQTIPASSVTLRPINDPPYYAIAIKQSANLLWNFVDDPEGVIAIEGTWGYGTSIPAPIVQAAVRLTSWLYRQRSIGIDRAQVEVNERGVAVAPPRLPHDIQTLLRPYTRFKVRIV